MLQSVANIMPPKRTRKAADKGVLPPKSKLARLEQQIHELQAVILARDNDTDIQDTLVPPPRPKGSHASEAGGGPKGGGGARLVVHQ